LDEIYGSLLLFQVKPFFKMLTDEQITAALENIIRISRQIRFVRALVSFMELNSALFHT
jgi:hypothetical protein